MAAAKSARSGKAKGGITLIRKEEVIEGGHHGGAWKVAYADFVTAMMAFFLLMWLLNATTEEQRRGIADYFSPIAALGKSVSGTGLPFGGRTPYSAGSLTSDRGAVQVVQGRAEVIPDVEEDDSETRATARQYARPGTASEPTDGVAATLTAGAAAGLPGTMGALAASGPTDARGNGPVQTQPVQTGASQMGAGQIAVPGQATAAGGGNHTQPGTAEEPGKAAAARLEQAAAQLRAAVRNDPALADLSRQLSVDVTPEGLRIQILDEEQKPMFATGSSVPNDRARMLVQKIGQVLQRMSESIAIVGHTDAAPYHGGDRSNWELSAERANATRRLLGDAGVPDSRVRSVSGDADHDPLLPADPFAAANRRIGIFVLRSPTQSPGSPAPGTAAAGMAGLETGAPVGGTGVGGTRVGGTGAAAAAAAP